MSSRLKWLGLGASLAVLLLLGESLRRRPLSSAPPRAAAARWPATEGALPRELASRVEAFEEARRAGASGGEGAGERILILGCAVDGTGRGVAGVRLGASSFLGEPERTSEPSGDDGWAGLTTEFLDEHMPVQLTAPDGSFWRGSVGVRPGELVHLGVVELEPGGRVAGRVTNAWGVPWRGVEVRLLSPDLKLRWRPRWNPREHTGWLGGFELVGVAPGEYVVGIDSPDHGWVRSTSFRVRAGETARAGLVYGGEEESSRTIATGRVRTAEGASPGRVLFELEGHLRGPTSPQGTLEFPEGRVGRIHAWDPLGYHGEGWADWSSSEAAPHLVTLSEANPLPVVVRSAAATAEDRLVVLVSHSNARDEWPFDRTDPWPRLEALDFADMDTYAVVRGRFDTSLRLPLPSEGAALLVTAPGHATRRLDASAVGPNGGIALEPVPRVRGRVKGGGPNLVVTATPHGEPTLHGPRTDGRADRLPLEVATDEVQRVLTGEEGVFEFALYGPGLYRVRAEVADLVGELDFEAPSNEELVLEVFEPGSVSGRVLDAAGLPVPGWLVLVGKGDLGDRSVRTGGDGSFRFEGLAPGSRWNLHLTGPANPVERVRTTRAFQVHPGEETSIELRLGSEPQLDANPLAR